jgi:hypothetical protein
MENAGSTKSVSLTIIRGVNGRPTASAVLALQPG